MHRAVHGPRIALLEIRPSASADEQAVAGEGHALVVQDVGDAAVSVAWRRPHLEIALAEDDALAVREVAVGALGAADAAERDPAAETLLQEGGAGHVIRM